MSCDCRKGATCPECLAEADLRVPSPAFYEERIRLLTEERDGLVARIVALEAALVEKEQALLRCER